MTRQDDKLTSDQLHKLYKTLLDKKQFYYSDSNENQHKRW